MCSTATSGPFVTVSEHLPAHGHAKIEWASDHHSHTSWTWTSNQTIYSFSSSRPIWALPWPCGALSHSVWGFLEISVGGSFLSTSAGILVWLYVILLKQADYPPMGMVPVLILMDTQTAQQQAFRLPSNKPSSHGSATCHIDSLGQICIMPICQHPLRNIVSFLWMVRSRHTTICISWSQVPSFMLCAKRRMVLRNFRQRSRSLRMRVKFLTLPWSG